MNIRAARAAVALINAVKARSIATATEGTLGTVSNAASGDFDFLQIWQSVADDVAFIQNGGHADDLLRQPLFLSGEGWSGEDFAAFDMLARNHPEFRFWCDWAKRAYYGHDYSEIEWQKLRAIGAIDKNIWSEGAKAVALEIAQIEERFAEEKHDHRKPALEDTVRTLLRVSATTITTAEGLSDTIDAILRETHNGGNERPDFLLIMEEIGDIAKQIAKSTEKRDESSLQAQIAALEAKVVALTEALQIAQEEAKQAAPEGRPSSWKLFCDHFATGTAKTLVYAERAAIGYFLLRFAPETLEEFVKVYKLIK